MAGGITLFSLLVRDYDEALAFYIDKLGFELLVDRPATKTSNDQPKRWIEIRPPRSTGAGLLLAQADSLEQAAVIGKQFGDRVGLFWHVEDFDTVYSRMLEHDVTFLEQPRSEIYGKVVVFEDLYGNKWDLMEPRESL